MKSKIAIVFALAAASLLAQPKGKTPAAQPSGDSSSELTRLREIADLPEVTRQELADVCLSYLEKYEGDAAARVAAATEAGCMRGEATSPLTASALAAGIQRTYKINRGILFRLTGFRRYALRDLQFQEILATTLGPDDRVSGAELLSAFAAAERTAEVRAAWPEEPASVLNQENSGGTGK